jgi:hypothetical protein
LSTRAYDSPSPEAGVSAGRKQVQVKHRDHGEDRLDEGFAPCTVLGARAVHAMEQFAGGDRDDRDFLVRAEGRRQPLTDEFSRHGLDVMCT